MTTPRLALEQVPSNSLQPSVPINDHLQALDALVQGSVVQALRNAPPTTLAADAGICYIVGDNPTGLWAGKGFNIAICTGANAWRFLSPKVGMAFYVQDQGAVFVYHSTGWGAEIRVATKTADAQLALSDRDVLLMDSAAANTLTVPQNAVVPFPIGRRFRIVQKGVGATSVAAATGVTIRSSGSLSLGTQYATGTLEKVGEDEWVWATAGGGIADGSVTTAKLANGAASGIKLGAAVNSQAASYTAVLTDANSAVVVTAATANTFTVPPNSAVAFPVGTFVEVWQGGAGQTTITAGAGVTILRHAGLTLKMKGLDSGASLRKVAADTWRLAGDMEATP